VLTLRVNAPQPSTLLVIGAVTLHSSASSRVTVVIDGVAFTPSMRTDVRDAAVALPVHAEASIAAGDHTIEVRVAGGASTTVSERIVTALVYEELP
jgi:hypothetical protein